jgi:CHRD domain-containing protein
MRNRAMTLAIAGVAMTAVFTLDACSDKITTTNTNPTPTSTIVTFKATMNGPSEVPANTTTGTGSFTATLDTATNIFTYAFTFTGLTTPVNNGHIHGPATTTVAAGTTINFNTLPGAQFSFGQTAGTGSGVSVLSTSNQITATMNGDSLKKLLFAGLTYVNIHTTQNPGGEIRGQITKQ